MTVALDVIDQQLLDGRFGEAAAFAMGLLHEQAVASGAQRFLTLQGAHVASAYDNTPVNLDFARELVRLQARVRVPTTLTSCAFDTQRPLADAPERQRELLQLHRAMGCQPALTCAPYLGHAALAPKAVLAWCESSAIVYANSVAGARCQRFPEFLDLCAALTGRVPELGLLRPHARHAQLRVDVSAIPRNWFEDRWAFEALGLWLGQECGQRIPALEGLPASSSKRDLCALGAAAAASGALDMFHAIGLTPEAPDRIAAYGAQEPKASWTLTPAALETAARALNRHRGAALSALCLGAPHGWAEDATQLLAQLKGRSVAPGLRCYFATNQAVLTALQSDGTAAQLRAAGVQLVTGRCTYYAPTLPGCDGHVATTSAKWAWYARQQLDCDISFLRLPEAVEAACEGRLP